MAHSKKVRDKLTKHHRKCKANGGTDNPKNIAIISKTKHEAWHTLTGHMHPDDIAILFNSHFLDPDYKFICVKKP